MTDPAGARVVLFGVGASPGIAVGPVRRTADPLDRVDDRVLDEPEIEPEIVRFHEALERARGELETLRETAREDVGEEAAAIFDVQLMVLQDPLAVDRTVEAIRGEKRTASALFRRHVLEFSDHLAGMQDSYFSDRAVDLLDVQRRVLRHLRGEAETDPSSGERTVLYARELSPSEAVRLDPERVLGLVTETGGATSHAAIMARARGIPAVMGVKGAPEALRDGDVVAVDGFRGRLEIRPDTARQAVLERRREAFAGLHRRCLEHVLEPAVTLDGRRIRVGANMELPVEIDAIAASGADGIGLFRTEFFFMWNQRIPNEREQAEAYGQVFSRDLLDGVTVRVLDVGGDKVASYMGATRDRDPFVGMRGIRYLLAHPELFKTQLRAILRSGAGRSIRILFPMVGSMGEFLAARELTREARQSLIAEGVDVGPLPSVGVMIEVPSSVLIAEELAVEADFFSVGSNDLIQYLLAIDRNHPDVGHLYEPHHPAVLRALRHVIRSGKREGIPVSLCGEMAGEPRSVPLLVGLGYEFLSVSPSLLPEVKQAVRSLDYGFCRELADEAVEAPSVVEVNALLDERLGPPYTDFLELMERGMTSTGGDAE